MRSSDVGNTKRQQLNIRSTIVATVLLVSTFGFTHARQIGRGPRRVKLDKEGGTIELRIARPDDAGTRDKLRQQLQNEIQTDIGSWTPAIRQHSKDIRYQYESTALGGKLHLIAKNRQALEAVWEFLQLQMRSSENGALAFEYIPNTALVVVPVLLDHHGPYRFLLDTGASNTIVSTEVAQELKIAKGARRTIVTAGGNISVTARNIRLVELGAVRLENIEIAAGEFALLKAMAVDGILGSDYLHRFKISIDYDAQTVTIEPSSPEIGSKVGPCQPSPEVVSVYRKCAAEL